MNSTDVGTGRGATIRFDPFETVPSTQVLRDAAAVQDWPRLSRFFEGVRDPNTVMFGIDALAEIAGIESFLQTVLAQDPDDLLARALLAARYVRIGWFARGGAYAKSTSTDQFAEFYWWLRSAEQILVDLCAERPDLAPAWATRLMTARGLELGQAETRRRYTRLAEHHPHVVAAQEQLLQQLCPKWSGSWEAATTFARESAADAPPGAPSGTLVASVHIERWLEADDAKSSGITTSDVRDELCAAARRSVWAPETNLGLYEVHVHSAFTLALSLGGHAREAAPHFRVLGDRASMHVWRYLGDPAAAFRQFRRAALAAEEGAR